MANANQFSTACTEMGAHEACIIYSGLMCQEGALALERQLEQLFGYYQYRRITLSIESPGGAIDGLEYILRVIQKWAQEGRAVAVRSTFQCASAAAFLLAMGDWGHRRVDRAVFLLFHSARIEAPSMAGMTAAYSTNLSHVLSSVDRKLLDVLLEKMLTGSGSVRNLADLVMMRARHVDQNWKQLASDLTTFTSGVDGSRKPDWLRAVQKWSRLEADPGKLVLELKKHLNLRLQRDIRMDLCEAWVLCLIDEIAGVLDADSVAPEMPVQVISPESLPDEAVNERAQHTLAGERIAMRACYSAVL
ncbi:MAG: ATP-dependent Clp protease proteolytic subunit [Rhodoferax sp.]